LIFFGFLKARVILRLTVRFWWSGSLRKTACTENASETRGSAPVTT